MKTMEKKMADYAKIVKEVIKSQKRGGDDFDVIERVSISLEIPRRTAMEVYTNLKMKETG